MKPECATSKKRPKAITLLDKHYKTIEDYVTWLYTSKIPIELYTVGSEDTYANQAKADSISASLVHAYNYGEELVDIVYKNAVVQTMFAAQRNSCCYFGRVSVKAIYHSTPLHSPLRRFFSDCVAHSMCDESEKEAGWIQSLNTLPSAALVDVLKAMTTARKSETWMALRSSRILKKSNQDVGDGKQETKSLAIGRGIS
jgi:hypothetical protein